jgi:hypothetical protein
MDGETRKRNGRKEGSKTGGTNSGAKMRREWGNGRRDKPRPRQDKEGKTKGISNYITQFVGNPAVGF